MCQSSKGATSEWEQGENKYKIYIKKEKNWTQT